MRDEAAAFPPELEATRAAPASHRVLLENAAVRVLEVTIEPGVREPVHVHQWPSVMIVDGPAPIRYYGSDGALEYESPPRMSLAPRPPRWLEPEGPHSVENIGDRPYHALRIEVKPQVSSVMGEGMSDRVANHFRLFNDAVRREDWTDFLGTFAPDAVMRFENVPAGPYDGLDAIRAAYDERPPDDTMHYVSGDRDGDEDVVRFGWDAGGGGTLRVCWRDGKVATLTIAFDAS